MREEGMSESTSKLDHQPMIIEWIDTRTLREGETAYIFREEISKNPRIRPVIIQACGWGIETEESYIICQEFYPPYSDRDMQGDMYRCVLVIPKEAIKRVVLLAENL